MSALHSWIKPHPHGLRARCGGPAFCSVCRAELAAVQAANPQGHRFVAARNLGGYRREWRCSGCGLVVEAECYPTGGECKRG